jgi:hypothetical protein
LIKGRGWAFFHNWCSLTTPYSTRGHIKEGDIYILYIFTKQTDSNISSTIYRDFRQCRIMQQLMTTNVSYNRSSLYRLCTDNTENTSHVIPSQRVHWRAGRCLATSYIIRPQWPIFHYCTLERVYRAIA